MRDPAELISAYFDDSLAKGELAELRAWLAADPARLRQFVLESVVHSRLRDVLLQHDMRGLVFDGEMGDAVNPEHIASLLDEEEAVAARRARAAAEQARREALAARREELLDRKLMRIDEPRVPPALLYASFAAAAVLLVMAGWFLGAPPKPHRQPIVVARQAPAEPPVVAEVAATFDAVLRRDLRPLAAGARLQAGLIVLEQGAAELRFVSGAAIVVEGPAELELMTGERAKLVSGRVVAQVPQEALGFTLYSDAAAFVDLGTEFGVEIGDAGRASIHVLDGEVALVSGQQDAAPSRTLQQGVANEVHTDGSIREIPFDASRFLRRVPASAYELAVLKSRPLAYWRLDQWEPNAAVVSEGRLAASSFVNAGIVTADNRAPGRQSEGPARAALFEGEHDGIDVAADAALGMVSHCTYEAWVQAGDARTGPKRIVSTFDRPRSGMAIGVVDGAWYKLPDDELKFQLTVYGVYDCISVTPVPLNEWIHVAATIDAAGTPTLYVNGAAVERRFRPLGLVGGAAADDDAPAAWLADAPTPIGQSTAGQARIGRNPVGSDGQISPERWQGQISNVAVYDRALEAAEIRRHFEATRSSLVEHNAERNE